MNKRTIYLIIFLVILAFLPFFLSSAWLSLAITFLIFSIVAFSGDIILGRAGVFNMGHAIFFGLGAYATAILNTHFHFSIISTLPFAIILPLAIAYLIISPIIHLRGDYLLVATIGFNIIFEQVLSNNPFGLTGGPDGIFGIDLLSIFGFTFSSQMSIYYLAFGILVLSVLLLKALNRSKYGRALFYINKDEVAAKSMGINISQYKLFAFGLGASMAGLAGFVFALQNSAVSPESFNFMQSVMFFAIILVGGGASMPGILAGTFIMFILPELFTSFKDSRYLIFGIAMIVTMILRPNGLLPMKFGDIPNFLKPKKEA